MGKGCVLALSKVSGYLTIVEENVMFQPSSKPRFLLVPLFAAHSKLSFSSGVVITPKYSAPPP